MWVPLTYTRDMIKLAIKAINNFIDSHPVGPLLSH